MPCHAGLHNSLNRRPVLLVGEDDSLPVNDSHKTWDFGIDRGQRALRLFIYLSLNYAPHANNLKNCNLVSWEAHIPFDLWSIRFGIWPERVVITIETSLGSEHSCLTCWLFVFWSWFKGSLTRDFWLQVFFMNQCPPGPQVFHWGRFEFFRKFAEIFAN